tara:strand:+ start:1003 stop:1143 length:141 start_codon:yes stop_codon:yes gene_type:complete
MPIEKFACTGATAELTEVISIKLESNAVCLSKLEVFRLEADMETDI